MKQFIRLLVVIVLSSPLLLQARSDDSMIASNKKVAIDSTTTEAIKHIFLGKTSMWGDGKKVSTCYLDDSSFTSNVIEKMVGRSESSFYAYWNRMLFSGTATPPVAFKTPEEVVAFLEKNDGAICYLPAASQYASANIKNISIR